MSDFGLISIAPMMDYTDTHLRYFIRLITKHALLYTEMITTEAILRGDRKRLLNYHPLEHPLAIQLGGSDPKSLAKSAYIAEDYGFDEINLNVGCPSDRVQKGRFGACLMKEPELVADCVASMINAVKIPVTVKTRIGVDDKDGYEDLCDLVEKVHSAGCNTFIFHARKAWLKGLSPKENRQVPPLRHDIVYQLKKDFPELTIILNGGIQTISQMQEALTQVDGVMIGRSAYQNPYLFSEVDSIFYGASSETAKKSRLEIFDQFLPYVESQLKQGARVSQMSRHLLGLFYGTPSAKIWKNSVHTHFPSNRSDELLDILKILKLSGRISGSVTLRKGEII